MAVWSLSIPGIEPTKLHLVSKIKSQTGSRGPESPAEWSRGCLKMPWKDQCINSTVKPPVPKIRNWDKLTADTSANYLSLPLFNFSLFQSSLFTLRSFPFFTFSLSPLFLSSYFPFLFTSSSFPLSPLNPFSDSSFHFFSPFSSLNFSSSYNEFDTHQYT